MQEAEALTAHEWSLFCPHYHEPAFARTNEKSFCQGLELDGCHQDELRLKRIEFSA